MTDQLREGMKIFDFNIEVRDGEHEYTHHHLVQARNEQAAERKARKYAETFLLTGKMTWTDETHLEPAPRNHVEYRIIEFDGVSETTVEEVLSRLLIE